MENEYSIKQHKLEKYNTLKRNTEKMKGKYERDWRTLITLRQQYTEVEAKYTRTYDKVSELKCSVNRYINYLDELKSKRAQVGKDYSHYDISIYESAMRLYVQQNRQLVRETDDLRIIEKEYNELKNKVEQLQVDVDLERQLLGEMCDMLRDFTKELTAEFDNSSEDLNCL